MAPFTACSLPSPLGPLHFCALGLEHLNEIDQLEQASSPHPWSRANIASSLGSSHRGLALRWEGKLFAYGFVSIASVEAELLIITVAKKRQGQGFGRLLLATIIEQLKGRVSEMFLEVRPSNTAALALYESLGFNQVGVRPRYYPGPRGGEDAWVMGLCLEAE
ncbi:MAG TPA: ribosomal protein S18-alanine N-acetyltransferase [Cellvibrionaceae bacterium]|nr:ribosomal protein S18-alanine N-acetyltransferase [Cellvibrionaceae bacterium]